ncbi:MAG: lamin tail domain-containing protein [Patescibacteria group bacterium]|jgi:hypothetical protein|nr:lamin tail domain-containing protein [Patescibacteria group bacterium]
MKKCFYLLMPLALVLTIAPVGAWATETTVAINEVAWMGTENSGNDEWLELLNTTANEIDLTGWKLEGADGSPSINLEGIIGANSYWLLERTDDDSVPGINADQIYSGSLSNAGEWLKLFDAQGNLIDEINNSEGWMGGDNATKQTLERLSNGSWQTSPTAGGSPKAANSTEKADDDSLSDSTDENDKTTNQDETESTAQNEIAATKASKGDIIIAELFANPPGNDLQDEFLELENVSKKIINITDWKITNKNKGEFIIPSFTLNPGSMVIFYRSQTNLALENAGDKITLYNNSRRIIDQIEYQDQAPEGQSLQQALGQKNHWAVPSPNQKNIFTEIILPVASCNKITQAEVGQTLEFDASDSFDPLNRKLEYHWDFGNGNRSNQIMTYPLYHATGTFEIILTVSVDEYASSTEKFKIKISNNKQAHPISPATTTPTSTEALNTENNSMPESQAFIFISEFLPNPKGSDDQEFIELFNPESYPVNLKGWKLDDIADGGSKPYQIAETTIIKPGQYLALEKTQTKINLNNDSDEINLINPDGRMVDWAGYETSHEGQSLILDENYNWQETQTPSPGEINILDQTGETDEQSTEAKTKVEATGKILGSSTTESNAEISAGQEKNKMRYLVAGISAAVILSLAIVLKKKKKL